MTEDTLLIHIEDCITSEVFLEDVPYSMEEGAQQVSSSSVSDAAKKILKMLIADGIISDGYFAWQASLLNTTTTKA